MKNCLILKTIIFSILFSLISSVSLRTHEQMTTFADILTNSNHINEQAIPGSDVQPNKSNPKIAASIIIPIICVGLCLIFCFFCLKCAQNQQEQAERGLQQKIPCYCGPVKLLCKCCRYLLCIDIILRCLGMRRTTYEKQEEKRMKEEDERRKKQEKERLKWEKQHGNSHQNHGPNPYQSQMQPAQAIHWTQATDGSDMDKISKQKCVVCQKKNPNILTACSNHCQLHLQCLISFKNQNKMSKASNQCPGCHKNYQNKVRYFCQKCHSRCTEMQIESGNVYVSQLDYGEALKSIGGSKCDECIKKRWWQ